MGGALKIGNDAIFQRMAEAGLALADAGGIAWDPGDAHAGEPALAYLTSRSAPIAGGTAEIVRNNVSEKVLGLPREPGPARDTPFKEIPHN
jgi:hypothetical protein